MKRMTGPARPAVSLRFSAPQDALAWAFGPTARSSDGIDIAAGVEGEVFPAIAPAGFTPGTRIATTQGLIAVEWLQAGDLVLTRDSGYRPLRWTGAARSSTDVTPVRIVAGALGPGMPARDIYVSPCQAILLTGDAAASFGDDHEVLVAAELLEGRSGIAPTRYIPPPYAQLLFDRHEVICADGLWTASFRPEPRAVAGLGQLAKNEMIQAVPALRHLRTAFEPARRIIGPASLSQPRVA